MVGGVVGGSLLSCTTLVRSRSEFPIKVLFLILIGNPNLLLEMVVYGYPFTGVYLTGVKISLRDGAIRAVLRKQLLHHTY